MQLTRRTPSSPAPPVIPMVSITGLGAFPVKSAGWKPSGDLRVTSYGQGIDRIANGEFDGYWQRTAVDLKALGVPVIFRLFMEMNGLHNPFCATFQGGVGTGGEAAFASAWRRVRSVFAATGASIDAGGNCIFVFCAQRMSTSGSWKAYWPGDDQVDWSGVDLYRTTFEAGAKLAAGDMDTYTWAVDHRKPYIVCESGFDQSKRVVDAGGQVRQGRQPDRPQSDRRPSRRRLPEPAVGGLSQLEQRGPADQRLRRYQPAVTAALPRIRQRSVLLTCTLLIDSGRCGTLSLMTKIAFIGAGSVEFTKNLLGDILSFEELKDAHIALHDIDSERLGVAEAMARYTNRELDGSARITTHLDRRSAIEGCDHVINMIQVGGFEATKLDFAIPAAHGLRQTIGDTLGIGGIFRALRTIPVMLEIGREMDELAPGAWFLNYTNPMAMLCWATYAGSPQQRVVGLCHSVQNTTHELAELVGVPVRGRVVPGWRGQPPGLHPAVRARRRGSVSAARPDDRKRSRAAAARAGRDVSAVWILPHRVERARGRISAVGDAKR